MKVKLRYCRERGNIIRIGEKKIVKQVVTVDMISAQYNLYISTEFEPRLSVFFHPFSVSLESIRLTDLEYYLFNIDRHLGCKVDQPK